LARLEEAIGLMQRLWSEPLTTFRGRFYEVVDAPMVATEPVRPRLLIGGGGRLLLGMGGRLAESVSTIPRQGSGEWSAADSIPDSTLARMIEKQRWVREGAAQNGRDPSSIELNTMVVKVIVGDDPHSAVESEAAASGVTPEQLSDSSLYLCGTGDEVRDHLDHWREQTGISYFSLFDPGDEQIEYLAEHVVGPLSGR
jgi:alkanesulfonate monooxygenase SsuD/methylene tetrahydromethanopterin reductase-like flavin-dependent oxidoreductase (luciferase family)